MDICQSVARDRHCRLRPTEDDCAKSSIRLGCGRSPGGTHLSRGITGKRRTGIAAGAIARCVRHTCGRRAHAATAWRLRKARSLVKLLALSRLELPLIGFVGEAQLGSRRDRCASSVMLSSRSPESSSAARSYEYDCGCLRRSRDWRRSKHRGACAGSGSSHWADSRWLGVRLVNAQKLMTATKCREVRADR